MMSNESTVDFTAFQAALAGTYSVERELGRGGMGTVFLARDVSLDRPVAIKVLHAKLAVREELRERFLREARTGARLSHPNIVPIYAVDEAAGFVYFVMGLVDGESTGARLRRQGPLPTAEVEGILGDIGWALAHAHAMGIVHRDVTLDNILIERSTGRALLADFGIAAEVDRGGEGPLVGTPAYLAPELIQGGAPSPQSDMYALGVSAWALLAGRLPFAGDDTAAILVQHVTEAPPSLAAAAPGASARLVRAVERALSKEPATRGDSVEAWLSASDTAAARVALAAPLSRWLNRWQVVRPFYALGMSLTAMVGLQSGAADNFYGGGTVARALVAMLHVFTTVFAFVAVVHIGIELAFLRRLFRDGYGVADLQLALRRHRTDRRHAAMVSPALLGRVVNDLAWLGGTTYVLITSVLMRNLRHILTGDSSSFMVAYSAIMDIARWAYILFWTGLGLNFLVPSFHFRPDGLFDRIVDRFWRSRLASGLMRVASFGLGKQRGAEQTLHRPTELVLDLAIDDLWSALPEVTRRGLHELPVVAESLRERVAEMKELTRELEAPALAGVAEATALRGRLRERQEAGITALERLRLQLAGLLGEAAPTGALTEQLRDARALEGELLMELGGHPSLKRLLKRRPSGSHLTPTPSPAV
jgi:hypothetical protein